MKLILFLLVSSSVWAQDFVLSNPNLYVEEGDGGLTIGVKEEAKPVTPPVVAGYKNPDFVSVAPVEVVFEFSPQVPEVPEENSGGDSPVLVEAALVSSSSVTLAPSSGKLKEGSSAGLVGLGVSSGTVQTKPLEARLYSLGSISPSAAAMEERARDLDSSFPDYSSGSERFPRMGEVW